MPPKRKMPASTKKQEKKKPPNEKLRLQQQQRKAAKMAAELLNAGDLRQELIRMLGDKISPSGMTFVSVPSNDSEAESSLSQDPLSNSNHALDAQGQIDEQSDESVDEDQSQCLTKPESEKDQKSQLPDSLDTEEIEEPIGTCIEAEGGGQCSKKHIVKEAVGVDPQFMDSQDYDEHIGDEAADAEQCSREPTVKEVVPMVVLAEPVKPDIQNDSYIVEYLVASSSTMVVSEAPAVTDPDHDEAGPEQPLMTDWQAKYFMLEEGNKHMKEQIKKLKKKINKLELDKASSDDYALRVGKELLAVKDKQQLPRARFTEEDDIRITVKQLEDLNGRAATDSMFAGLLAIHLLGTEQLKRMSVTGQPSHRFASLKKPDGTPLYPPTQKIDPKVLVFICNKVAERTAIRIGPENVTKIRMLSEERVIKRYIAQKIANLKKAAKPQQPLTQDDGNGVGPTASLVP